MTSNKKDTAVSPVVGVMLMLVVTIVIAAIVAAFAGGVATSVDQTPTYSIKADTSVENGMTITCLGITSGKPTEFDVYAGSGDRVYKIKSSVASDKFTPGTSISISSKELDDAFIKAYGKYDGYQNMGAYIPNKNFIGNIYIVKLFAGDTCIGETYTTLRP